MRIAVVGARGQLGAAVAEACGAAHETVTFTRADLDTTDDAAVAAAMARVRPDAIVNASAYTNVDGAEDEPVTALNVNALAVRALARAAETHGAALVHFSTDFVFDGAASAPYTEQDRPNPRSVYATSKLLGEWFALESPRGYVLQGGKPVRQRGRWTRAEGQRRRHPQGAAGRPIAASLHRSHDFANLRDRRRPRDAEAPRILRAGGPVPLRQFRFVHAGSTSRRSWRGSRASSRASPRCACRTCSFARPGRCIACSPTPNFETPASTCRRGRTRWRGTSRLGQAPNGAPSSTRD